MEIENEKVFIMLSTFCICIVNAQCKSVNHRLGLADVKIIIVELAKMLIYNNAK